MASAARATAEMQVGAAGIYGQAELVSEGGRELPGCQIDQNSHESKARAHKTIRKRCKQRRCTTAGIVLEHMR